MAATTPSCVGQEPGRGALRKRHDMSLDVAPGDADELLVGGEPGRILMAGYLANPDATAEALRPDDGGLT
ncbi:MAG: hypothetical protein ACRDZO_09110 [Egibacteraceae bacterium]